MFGFVSVGCDFMETEGSPLIGLSLRRKVRKHRLRVRSTPVRTKIGSAAGKSPGKLSLSMGDTVQEGGIVREEGESNGSGERMENREKDRSGKGKNRWVKMSVSREEEEVGVGGKNGEDRRMLRKGGRETSQEGGGKDRVRNGLERSRQPSVDRIGGYKQEGDREWHDQRGWGGEERETRPSELERWGEQLREEERSRVHEGEFIRKGSGKSARGQLGEDSGYAGDMWGDGRGFLNKLMETAGDAKWREDLGFEIKNPFSGESRKLTEELREFTGMVESWRKEPREQLMML